MELYDYMINNLGATLIGLYKKVSIILKDKIDENIFTDTLIKLGFISDKREIRNSKEKTCFHAFFYEQFVSSNKLKCMIVAHIEESLINIFSEFSDYAAYAANDIFILKIKEILFKEKILNEIYDRAKEYKDNYQQYEANTDDIIEKVECRENINPYSLFIIKHFIKFVMDKYKEELALNENNTKNEVEKEEVKELNIEKLNPIIRKCEDKIIEIKEIIKDFDYSDRKTYEELTSKVESDFKELENTKNINKINEIIDEINEIYRNAYNKKNNVSALSYIMETDEDIDLIKKIDIENLE